MANRIITATVTGENIKMPTKYAGTKGSFKATTLAFAFDDKWDGTTKKVTFFNRYSANPVTVLLTTDLLVDGKYMVDIPAEPLEYGGEFPLTVRGVELEADGVTTKRVIISAHTVMNAGETDIPSSEDAPVEPTPTQAEQLLTAVNSVTGMTATAVELASGVTAYVTKTDNVDGTINLEFGLPAGPQGTQGIQGEQGIQGVQGIQGIQGIQGYRIGSVYRKSGTGASGTTDVYGMKLNDVSETEVGTFNVYNGADGEGAGDMLASVYDPNAKNADAFSLANMVGDSTHRVVTDTEKSTWNGKQNATNSLTAETAIVDGDYIPFYDTSVTAHRKTLWSNIKTVLGSTFAALSHTHGNITNNGKVGSTADLPIFTSTDGAIVAKTIADAKTLLGVSDNNLPKLLAVTVGTAAPSISLDLSGITMTNYSKLVVIANITTANATTVTCLLNNQTTGYYSGAYLSGSSTSVTTLANNCGIFGTFAGVKFPVNLDIILCPTSYPFVAFCGGQNNSASPVMGFSGFLDSAAISTLKFVAASGNISVGSTFVVYGVKK